MVRKPSLPEVKKHIDFINRSFKGDTLKLVLYLYAESFLKGKKRTGLVKREAVAQAIGRSPDSIKKRSADLVKSKQLKVQKRKSVGHFFAYELTIPELQLSAKQASTKAIDRYDLAEANRKKSKERRFQNIELKRG